MNKTYLVSTVQDGYKVVTLGFRCKDAKELRTLTKDLEVIEYRDVTKHDRELSLKVA